MEVRSLSFAASSGVPARPENAGRPHTQMTSYDPDLEFLRFQDCEHALAADLLTNLTKTCLLLSQPYAVKQCQLRGGDLLKRVVCQIEC